MFRCTRQRQPRWVSAADDMIPSRDQRNTCRDHGVALALDRLACVHLKVAVKNLVRNHMSRSSISNGTVSSGAIEGNRF
jgi:hypothetical protein